MRFGLLFILLFFPSEVLRAETQIYSKIESLFYTPSQPFRQFESDWSAPYLKANRAIQYNWWELGFKYKNWSASIFHQEYGAIRYAPDSGEFYWLTENNKPLQIDRVYEVDIDVSYVEMQGFRLAHQFALSKSVKSEFGFSILKGSSLLSGSLKGNIIPLAEDDYEFDDIGIDYYYSNDFLFEREVSEPVGEGISVDWNLYWQRSRKTNITFEARNLYGYIKWRDTPYTVAKVSSDNKEYDENGYVIVHATLQGQHHSKNYYQRLPAIIKLRSVLQISDQWSVLFELFHTDLVSFPIFGATRFIGSSSMVEFFYTPNVDAIGLRFKNSKFAIHLSSDNLILNRSRYLSIGFQLSI